MKKLIYRNSGIKVNIGDDVVVKDNPCKVSSFILERVCVINSDTGHVTSHHVFEIGAEWRTT